MDTEQYISTETGRHFNEPDWNCWFLMIFVHS